MEITALQVTIDARKAIEQQRALAAGLLKTADAADAVSARGNRSVSSLGEASQKTYSQIAAARKETELWEKETIAMAQSTARLMVSQGNLSGAVNSLSSSLQGMHNQTNQLIGAQTQLANLQNRIRAQNAGGAGGAGGGAGGSGGIVGGAGGSGNASNFNSIAGAASSLTSRLIALGGAYLSLRGVMNIADSLIDAQIAMQRIEQTLSITTGSIEGARAQMEGLRSESNRIGVSFVDSASAFAKFQAAAEGSNISAKTIKETFTAVTQAASRLHLTSDQTRGAFLAIEQMVSKGTVSMEELRRQLGNYLPGVLSMSARAMQMTTKDFIELVKAGDLLTEDFLPKIAAQLSKEIPLGNANKSISAEIERLKNAWVDLKATVADGVNFKFVIERGTAELSEFTAGMKANRLYEKAQSAGDPGKFTMYPWNVDSQGKKQQAEYEKIFAEYERLLDKEFPFNTEKPFRGKNPEDAYLRRMQSAETDKEIYLKANPVLGPDDQPEARAPSEKQGDAMREVGEMRMKFQLDYLDGLEREQRQIDLNTQKQFEQIRALQKTLGPGFDGSQLMDMAMESGEAKKAAVSKKFGENEREKALKLETDQAKQLSVAYLELQKNQQEVDIYNAGGEKEQAIERQNQAYEKQHMALIVLSEDHEVLQGAYDEEEESNRRAMSAIEQRYEKEIRFNGTLIEGLQRRKELELEFLKGDADAVRQRQIQREMEGIDKSQEYKMRSGTAGPAESFIAGWEKAEISYGSISERMAKIGEGLSSSMDRNMTDAFVSWIDGSKSASQAFSEMSNQIVADLLRIMVQQLIIRTILTAASSIGGAFGGSYSVEGGTGSGAVSGVNWGAQGMPTMHSGGVVPESSPIFTGQRRYHSGGTIDDEVNVVARRGEGIYTPEQIAQMKGKEGKGTKVDIVNVMDQNMILEIIASNPSAILNVIGKNKTNVRKILA